MTEGNVFVEVIGRSCEEDSMGYSSRGEKGRDLTLEQRRMNLKLLNLTKTTNVTAAYLFFLSFRFSATATVTFNKAGQRHNTAITGR